jgi:hypothetical protein
MRRFVVLAVALSLTAVALGIWALAAGGRRAPDLLESDAAFGTLETIELDTATTGLAADGPLYRYSVIPGGVCTANSLRNAIQVDPVVAAHYQNLDQSKLQVRTVARDQYAYVSYRKGDEVLWTKNKVLLRQGETIITDGTKQVRAKCGNCISLDPQLPTAAEEPDVVEFDRLVDPVAPPAAGRPEVVLVPPSPVASGAPAVLQQLIPPVTDPLAAGRFSGGTSSPLAAGNRLTGGDPDMPGPPMDVPGPQFPLPPGSFPQPPGVVPTPPEDLLPTSDNPLLDEPPTWVPPTDLPPGNPVPVPEPGTLLLVGVGVAALVRRLHARTR